MPPEPSPYRSHEGAEETLIYRENVLQGKIIAPGERSTPIPLHRDINAEILSFPTIYGGKSRHFPSSIKVTFTDIAKSETRRYDRRACKPSHLFWAFKKSFNEKVHQALQVCMRKSTGNVTASNLRTPGFVDSLIRKDNGYAVFKNIRSSPAYWKDKMKKVLAMIRQLGKSTFFITLSAAETQWTELKVSILKKIYVNLKLK